MELHDTSSLGRSDISSSSFEKLDVKFKQQPLHRLRLLGPPFVQNTEASSVAQANAQWMCVDLTFERENPPTLQSIHMIA